jgi:hypothetical protein
VSPKTTDCTATAALPISVMATLPRRQVSPSALGTDRLAIGEPSRLIVTEAPD